MICFFLFLQVNMFNGNDSLVASEMNYNGIDRESNKSILLLRQNETNSLAFPHLVTIERDSFYTKQELNWLLCNYFRSSNAWTDIERKRFNDQIVRLAKMSPIQEMSLREERRLKIYGRFNDGIPRIKQLDIIGLLLGLYYLTQ